MNRFFRDKSFIVTGASSGIGRSLAMLLNRDGAKVTIMARTKAKLEQLNNMSKSRLLVCQGDVTREQDCKQAIQASIETFGKLDGLIHNAGVSMRAVAAETDIQTYRDLMEVNFFSMIYLYQQALPFIEKTNGHIVAVSSMMGRYSTQERAGYNASKHALQGFMDCIRLENMDKGIHVMVASPGFVKTNGSLNALTANGTPYGKMDDAIAAGLKPDQAAEIILSAIKSRKRDVYPAGFREKLGFFLSKWAPGKLDKILVKSRVK
ncbi:SDR family oxidoreductase [bacterium]|nr:SDR family oxidoreductase [bacterium]